MKYIYTHAVPLKHQHVYAYNVNTAVSLQIKEITNDYYYFLLLFIIFYFIYYISLYNSLPTHNFLANSVKLDVSFQRKGQTVEVIGVLTEGLCF